MIFFKIPANSVRVQQAPLSFNIFFRNNHTGKKNLACAKNDLLNAQRLEEIQERTTKGEELLIAQDDLKIFADAFGHEDEILELNSDQIKLRELQQEKTDALKRDYPEQVGLFSKLVNDARNKDNFSEMIKAAKAQIESFPLTKSHYFSAMISYTSFCLSRSGELPAGCAFAFFLAKKLKVTDQLELMEIVAAFSLRELGYAYLKLGREKNGDPDYKKYPMFSQHILALSKAPFSKHVSRMILEHRENTNQTGFPRGKGERHTHFHSYIIGATHLLFQTYHRELKGRFLDKALVKTANSGQVHPTIAANLHALKR